MTTDSHHHPSGMGAPVGPGLELRVRTTDTGSISVHQGVLGPGDEITLHVHDGADQVLYFVDAEVEVTIGTDAWLAAAELSDPTRFEALQAEHGVHPAGA